MAQVVCIDKDTLRPNCDIGDIVSMHEDDVKLTGAGYVGFLVMKIENRTVAQLRAMWTIPEQKVAVKLPVVAKWGFLEEKHVWKNAAGLWCTLVEPPKYHITLGDITGADRLVLADNNSEETVRSTILTKAKEKISLNDANNVEEIDLNS